LASFLLTVPETIITSACRGVLRKNIPKRSASIFGSQVAIISMAQQAMPKVSGHMLRLRAMLMRSSSVPRMMSRGRSSEPSRPI